MQSSFALLLSIHLLSSRSFNHRQTFIFIYSFIHSFFSQKILSIVALIRGVICKGRRSGSLNLYVNFWNKYLSLVQSVLHLWFFFSLLLYSYIYGVFDFGGLLKDFYKIFSLTFVLFFSVFALCTRKILKDY